jgi:hypothetical protein
MPIGSQGRRGAENTKAAAGKLLLRLAYGRQTRNERYGILFAANTGWPCEMSQNGCSTTAIQLELWKVNAKAT